MSDGVDRLVEVMDRLRSPGGCPWDAEQTHASLVPYAIEEVYELADAAESGSRNDLLEELGDVLLQVVFHARIAQEHPTEPFGLDQIAAGVADKLMERHPHVFGDVTVSGAAEVHANWERIKAESKARGSILDGIPSTLPALARAQKVVGRANRAGLDVRGPAGVDIGVGLLDLVARAEAQGVDAEAALRAATRAFELAILTAELLDAEGTSP